MMTMSPTNVTSSYDNGSPPTFLNSIMQGVTFYARRFLNWEFIQLVQMGVHHSIKSPNMISTTFCIVAALILCPTIQRFITALLRRGHHLGAVLFPNFFIRNPKFGPRHIPSYLLTDGLNRAGATFTPCKGNYTKNQLEHHLVIGVIDAYNMDAYQVSLLPTLEEALAGYHPGTHIQVSHPARAHVILQLQREQQAAIDSGTSEASSTNNLIRIVHNQLLHGHGTNFGPFLPNPTEEQFAAALLTHPGPKETCIALRNVLAAKQNKRTLGALYPLCEDLHVVIALTDHNRRESRLESLIFNYGRLPVLKDWKPVPW